MRAISGDRFGQRTAAPLTMHDQAAREDRSAAEAVRDLEALSGDPGATGDTVFEAVPSALGAAPVAAAVPPDEDTVLHRLSAADLDQLDAVAPATKRPPPLAGVPAGPPSLTSGREAPPASQTAISAPIPRLEQVELIVLGASFFVPGLGHLMLGQLKKGLILLAALAFTAGISWIFLSPAALADAFLVIRARKRRAVGDMELFPDFREVL